MYTHAYTSLNIYIYIDMLHFHMWLKFKNSIQFAFIFKRSSAASSHKLGNWVARRKSTKNNFVRFKVRWRPLMKRPWIYQGMEIPRDLKKCHKNLKSLIISEILIDGIRKLLTWIWREEIGWYSVRFSEATAWFHWFTYACLIQLIAWPLKESYERDIFKTLNVGHSGS